MQHIESQHGSLTVSQWRSDEMLFATRTQVHSVICPERALVVGTEFLNFILFFIIMMSMNEAG